MPNTREKLIDAIEKEKPYIPTEDYEVGYNNGLTMAQSIILATDNNVGDKWIPVSERLPEKYGKYLCRYVFNESAEYPHIEAISYYPKMTRFQGEGSCGMRVTHWMPLPEPPKGE